LLERVAKLKKTVPNELVYTIFFREMAAREKYADDLARAGHAAAAADLRDLPRQVMQVQPEQFSVLRSAALQCAAELASYDAQEQLMVKTQALTPRPSDAPPGWKPPELAQLDAQRADALARTLAVMRKTLGDQAFAVTDYWIYSYITARLRRSSLQAAPGLQKGGK
jgi:hypothetical protein